ncbi:MAG: universal stress protein [Burkholderiales bacterium]|nr:universal stress protein [Burkholderiales bacterium]
MYDRILVPVDGSAFSEEVVPHALGMVRATGAALSLLQVVDREDERAEATRYVGALATELGAEGRAVLARGDLADTILAEARRVPRTLIAMTSHGRSGLMEAMMGSVAMRIVRTSGDPIVLYRPRGAAVEERRQAVKISSVVLPLDGTPTSEEMASQAAGMAQWLGADLSLVQAITLDGTPAGIPAGDVMESSYVRSRAEDYRKRYGVRANWEVLHGDPADAIARYLNERRDVLLAMATHARRPLEAAILGSVTAGCLRKCGVPIVTRLP